MSYIALARKYRPKTFNEIVGQTHALEGITNALDLNKFHHAYLLTGTRGVGKTTFARLIAKSLNCEQPTSSNPCNKCSACKEISQGKHVDIIEIDAASRTRVEDTKDLLDNVQYMPTQGKYKIYIIDEVHMLSNHSFNALLKTLEEPPEHVKFLLATTDPQKLPSTILSRCIQFHLKNLTINEISSQIIKVLQSEKIAYDDNAIAKIAEHSQGSMRDALTLLDQIISYSKETISLEKVSAILCTTEKKIIIKIANNIVDKNITSLIEISSTLINEGNNLKQTLNLLAELWHNISIFQAIKVPPGTSFTTTELNQLSSKISPRELQVLYEISIKSLDDILLAPNDKIGFEMSLLRMCAFSQKQKHSNIEQKAIIKESSILNNPRPLTAETITKNSTYHSQDKWNTIIQNINLQGVAKQILLNSTLESLNDHSITINIAPSFQELMSNVITAKIKRSLQDSFNKNIDINLIALQPSSKSQTQAITPAEMKVKSQEKAVNSKLKLAENNEIIIKICKSFDTTIEKNKIKTPISIQKSKKVK